MAPLFSPTGRGRVQCCVDEPSGDALLVTTAPVEVGERLCQRLKLSNELFGELVGMTRPGWLRQQSNDPRLFPGSLGGVKGGTGEGKQRGRVGDRIAINP